MTKGDVQESGFFCRFFQPYVDEFYLLLGSSSHSWSAFMEHRKRSCCGIFQRGRIPTGLGALVDIAGWVELLAALLIGFGVLTRLGAGALVVTMIVAYFGVHAALSPVWPWPHLYPNPPDGGNAFVAHGGEVTILFFICAGIIGILGSRKWGIERHFFNKELL